MKTYTMNSPYGYMLLQPFKAKVKNGTRLEFCHILGDCYVMKVADEHTNVRFEVPQLWVQERGK